MRASRSTTAALPPLRRMSSTSTPACTTCKTCPARQTAPGLPKKKFAAEAARWQGLWQAAARFGCPWCRTTSSCQTCACWAALTLWQRRGRVRFVRRMNDLAADWAAQHANFYVHDLCWLFGQRGPCALVQPAAWYAYKYACDVPYIPHAGTQRGVHHQGAVRQKIKRPSPQTWTTPLYGAAWWATTAPRPLPWAARRPPAWPPRPCSNI